MGRQQLFPTCPPPRQHQYTVVKSVSHSIPGLPKVIILCFSVPSLLLHTSASCCNPLDSTRLASDQFSSVHGGDERVDLLLPVAALAALHIVHLLLVHASHCRWRNEGRAVRMDVSGCVGGKGPPPLVPTPLPSPSSTPLPSLNPPLAPRHHSLLAPCSPADESLKGQRKLVTSLNAGPTEKISCTRSSMQITLCLPRCCRAKQRWADDEQNESRDSLWTSHANIPPHPHPPPATLSGPFTSLRSPPFPSESSPSPPR
jgi:hypothetical protein